MAIKNFSLPYGHYLIDYYDIIPPPEHTEITHFSPVLKGIDTLYNEIMDYITDE